MVEYITKEEVYTILRDAQSEAVRAGDNGTVNTVNGLIKQIRQMYAVRNNLSGRWIPIGQEAIYCSGCGFKTVVYKNTHYCPECGRRMDNGERRQK